MKIIRIITALAVFAWITLLAIQMVYGLNLTRGSFLTFLYPITLGVAVLLIIQGWWREKLDSVFYAGLAWPVFYCLLLLVFGTSSESFSGAGSHGTVVHWALALIICVVHVPTLVALYRTPKDAPQH